MDRHLRANVPRILRACGLILSALALVWIGLRFARGGGLQLLASVPITKLQLTVILAAGAIAYAMTMLLLAFAWWRMLVGLSPGRVAALPAMATYAVAQYGRYLPGNVAHYALRHAWNRRQGIPHESLAMAAALEAGLLLLVAFCLTLVANIQGKGFLSIIDSRLAIALLLAALGALWLALQWIRRRGGLGRLHVPALRPMMVLTSIACYAGFFVACAAMLNGLADALAIPDHPFTLLLATSAASWLAGFIVVGAPAGIGVREATFIALAGPQLGQDQALLLIGLFRVVTFLGDSLFLGLGASFQRIDAHGSRQNDSGQRSR